MDQDEDQRSYNFEGEFVKLSLRKESRVHRTKRRLERLGLENSIKSLETEMRTYKKDNEIIMHT